MLNVKHILREILILFLFLLSETTGATDVVYNRKEQEGLLFLNVSSIIKDQQGYIWFGTFKGLNRWDGYKYKYFLSNKNDPSSISSNKIQALLIDKEKHLWVATTNGLNRYDPITEKFTKYFHDPQNPSSISSNNIYCFDEDKEGNLWIGTENGINVYDRITNSFNRIDTRKFIDIPSENYSTIRYIYCGSDNNIWIGFTVSGILRIDAKTLDNTFFIADNQKRFINSVNDIVEIDNETMLFSTWGGKIFNYSKKDNLITPWEGNNLINSSVVDFIDIDNNGNLWITDHYQQILNITPGLEIINSYTTAPGSSNIPSCQISATYVDDKNIWFGTYNQGFFHINNTNKKVKELSNISPSLKELSTIQVTALTEGSNGDIFIGTPKNELYIYNQISGALRKIKTSKNNLTQLHYDSIDNRLFLGFYSSEISYIDLNTFKERVLSEYTTNYAQVNFKTTKDKLFIALWDYGLSVVDSDNKIKLLGKENWEKKFSTIQMTLEDTILWIASYNDGIISYNINTNIFTHYLIEDETESSLPTNQINLIMENYWSVQMIWDSAISM